MSETFAIGQRLGRAVVTRVTEIECLCDCGNTFRISRLPASRRIWCGVCAHAHHEAQEAALRAKHEARRQAKIDARATAHLREAIRRDVSKAIRKGLLQRPTLCESCKRTGIGRIAAHHDDYTKPLEIIWLCGSCHVRRHWRLRNEDRDPSVLHHRSILAAAPPSEAA